MKLNFEMDKLKFSTEQAGHPNIMNWEGIVSRIDSVSDGAPGGADGKRVVLTKAAVEKAYNTLNNMPLNCCWPDGWFAEGTEVFTGHDDDMIIGTITSTWIEGDNLCAKGVIWKALHPDIAFMAVNGKQSLGFSIEAFINGSQEGAGNGFIYVNDMTFCGCAMLWKNTAAWSSTQLRELAASIKGKRKDDLNMTKEEIKELMAGIMPEVATSIGQVVADQIKASFDQMNAKISEISTTITASAEPPAPEQSNAEIEQLKAQIADLNTKLEATSKLPERKSDNWQTTNDRFDGDKMKQEYAKIDALNLSAAEKTALKYKAKFNIK